MNKWTFFNGEFQEDSETKLHYTDLSIQRAYGIFDFLKVVDGKEQFVDDHLERFYMSAQAMRLEAGFDKSNLIKIIHELIEKNELRNGAIKITLTGGYSEDGYQPGRPNLIIGCNIINKPIAYNEGIKLITYPHQRQLPHIKTIDYIMPLWLQPVIKSHNADDVLYITGDTVTECPRSNFFIIDKDGRLITPENNILKGVTRKKVLEASEEIVEIVERDVAITDVYNAAEAFITSTTKMILPVKYINDHHFKSHKLTCQLQQLFSDKYGIIF
jgi:D-alanine transaminase/branched-chain amino acid aminotransferase